MKVVLTNLTPDLTGDRRSKWFRPISLFLSEFIFSVQKFFSNKNKNKNVLAVFHIWITWKRENLKREKLKLFEMNSSKKLILICFWYGEKNIWTILKTRRFEKRFVWKRERNSRKSSKWIRWTLDLRFYSNCYPYLIIQRLCCPR